MLLVLKRRERRRQILAPAEASLQQDVRCEQKQMSERLVVAPGTG